MTDSTAENADTLRKKLKNILTESFYNGRGIIDLNNSDDGSFGVLKEIDETIGILTCLRKVESKNQESDIQKVVVPKAFKCTFTNQIMIEPVIIASGQTYEKKYIADWLMVEHTCPKTKAVLSDLSLIPNHLVDELIREWCRVNKYERRSEEMVTELDTDGIESLLQRISSPSSVSDQTEAANELRRQTKKFANVRDLFSGQIPDSITRLLSPLSGLGFSNTELQENIITALFNISVDEKNRTVIAKNPLAIPVLTKSLLSLKQGTVVHTQRKSAATLWLLSVIDSNKPIIGNSGALVGLIHLIKEGDLVATRAAASAVYNLCTVLENRERAVVAGFIRVLIDQIRAGNNVDGLLALLASLSTYNSVIEVMENLGFINSLLRMLRRQSNGVTAENAVVIFFNMCEINKARLGELRTEENQYQTFTKLAQQGTHLAVQKAEAILQWFKRYRQIR